MCITGQCADPTQPGVWWRDDASWRLYDVESMRAILLALLKGKGSVELGGVQSAARPPGDGGASYNVDLKKMQQTNKATRHARAIKIILPPASEVSRLLLKAARSVPGDGVSAAKKEPAVAWFRMQNSCLLAIQRGDITKWKVDGHTDAVVNATSRRGLVGGGGGTPPPSGRALAGVDAAIRRAAGPQLQQFIEKSARLAGARSGDAIITDGFQLPASKIIHAVGPTYRSDEASSALLEKAYQNALSVAAHNSICYLAFPAISCGVRGFPCRLAAQVALRVVSGNNVTDGTCLKLKEVHFVLLDEIAWLEWTANANKSFHQA